MHWLRSQHFYEGQQVVDQVNVAYLRFAQQWYRLYFECATIFWRESEAPAAPENTDLAYGLLLNDLSGMEDVVGQVVQAVAYAGSESGDCSGHNHVCQRQEPRIHPQL